MQRHLHTDDFGHAHANTTREHNILTLWRMLNEEDRGVIQSALEEKKRLREIELQLANVTSLLSTLQSVNDT